MKITDIAIARCGVWRDTNLPLKGRGLQVFYGPNETGKSTLMRFIRGVLFGSPARASSPRGTSPSTWDGSLRVEHRGRTWDVRRTADALDGQTRPLRGHVSISSVDDAAPVDRPDEWLADALGGTSEELFEKVFAVGLTELQALATLHADGVSRHIYGTSLGPDGQRLLDAFARLDEDRARLLDGPGDRGLRKVSERRRTVAQELESLGTLRERYDELRLERGRLEAEIAALQERSATAQRQLRGHHLLEKAWAPWQQVDQLRREIKALPNVRRFPEGGVDKLRALDAEIASLTAERERLRTEVAECKRRAGGFTLDDDVQSHTRRMQSLLDSRTWIQDGYAQLTQSEAREKQLRRELDAALAPLNGKWTQQQLDAFDGSPAAQGKLVAAARGLQKSVTRRNRLRTRLKGWSRTCRVKGAEVADRLKSLGVASIEPAVAERRRRVVDLKNLERLLLEEDRLDEREETLRGQLGRLDKRLAYPDWLPLLLWFFAIGGVLAAFLGFRQGMQQNAVAGLMWLLLGATCGGLAWALKNHYDGAVGGTIGRLRAELQEAENESRKLEREIDALYRRATWLRDIPELAKGGMASVGHGTITAKADSKSKSTSDDEPDDVSIVSRFLAKTQDELVELERLSVTQAKVSARREKLSRLRQKFQTLNRDVTVARQGWSDALRRTGLPETTRAADAFATWEKLAEAHHSSRAWREASTQLSQTRSLVQPFEREVDQLGRDLKLSGATGRPAHEVIAGWENRLTSFAATRDERAKLVRDGRRKHREAAKITARLRSLRAQRAALLRDGGAKSRKSFETRAAARHRRAELDELLALAESELRSAGDGEEELALVEEDFRNFHAETHRQRLAACRSDCAAADQELRDAHERLGSLKQELKSLEADRREMPLRATAARLDAELVEGLEHWAALDLAGRALDELRSQYERNCQPATLAAASRWLERLTRGRYRSIWTPLGRRELTVEDDQGRTFGVDDLSSGAREQLFLAVRLAMVRQFREKGIDLPMVLDDVLVNFDQQRTEAALDTLAEFAGEGQQILLFTCHLHQARLAESRGLEPVWLPTHAAADNVERRAS